MLKLQIVFSGGHGDWQLLKLVDSQFQSDEHNSTFVNRLLAIHVEQVRSSWTKQSVRNAGTTWMELLNKTHESMELWVVAIHEGPSRNLPILYFETKEALFTLVYCRSPLIAWLTDWRFLNAKRNDVFLCVLHSIAFCTSAEKRPCY